MPSLGQKLTKADLAAAAALLVTKERGESPLAVYRHGPTAMACHRAQSRFRLVEGSTGTGKTELQAAEIGWMMTGTHPYRKNVSGQKFALFTPTRDQAHLIWRERLLGANIRPMVDPNSCGYIPYWEIKRTPKGYLDVSWDSSNGKPVPVVIRMKNGNELYLRWHGDPNIWKRFSGVEWYCAFIDEPGDRLADIMDEIICRFRRAYQDYPEEGGWVLYTGTDTLACAVMQEWRQRAVANPDKYAHFVLPPGENPRISKAAMMQVAEGLSEDGASVRVHATANAGDLRKILPQYDPKIHIAKEAYQPGTKDNIIVSYDPGVNIDDTGILFAYQGEENPMRINLFRFWAQRGMSTGDEAQVIKDTLAGRKILFMTYDQSGAGHKEKGTGTTIIQQLLESLQDPSIWVLGKPTLRKPKWQIMPGVKRLITYLSPPASISHEPLIRLDPPTAWNGLQKLSFQLMTYRRKREATKLTTGHIVEKDNEGPDTLRYIVTCSPIWQDHGPNMPGFRAPPPIVTDHDAWVKEQKEKAEALFARRNEIRRGYAARAAMMRSNAVGL